MNKTLVSLVKYVSSSKCGDFNGPFSELSHDDQIQYLRYFFDTYSKEKSFIADDKSYSDDEVKLLLNEVPFERFDFRNRRYLNNGNYCFCNLSNYEYLTLFNDCVVKENSIYFKKTSGLPLPAFEMEFDDKFDHISLSFSMSDEFKMPLRSNVDTMVSGRNIEFKNGLDEILKIGLYPNGSIYARVIKNDKYHHQNIYVGSFEFNQVNSFEVFFLIDKIKILINNVENYVDYSSKNAPNTLFVGSGIHGTSPWDIRVDCISSKTRLFNAFKKRENFKCGLFSKVQLPLVFGTYKNRHLACEYETSFTVERTKNIILNIDEIGPRAEIYINNVLVERSAGLVSYHSNITKFVCNGENKLKIIIFPNAPENVISWHRNSDLYFGSYLDGINIDEVSEKHIENVKIETVSTDNDIIFTSSLSGNIATENVIISIFDIKTNKLMESESKILDDRLFTTCHCKLWDFKHPNLYKVVYSLTDSGNVVDEYEVITGFRTIDQNNGCINLNGKRVFLNGALLMQYLPPYKDIPLNHVYCSFEDVIKQCLSAKKMNSTCLRMHQLGYGTNDKRIARVCDYLGISLIWTTKFNETILDVCNKEGVWKSKQSYQSQMIDVINNPSIIMWEGSNELYLYREDIDLIYKTFVNAIKEIDKTRLISPVSHLYYGNDLYDRKCQYYQDDGTKDEFFNQCVCAEQWNDPLVVRSAHTYDILLGYGSTWDTFRRQKWSSQPQLLNSDKHAYIISEYAIIGRQCPYIEEKQEFFNNNSYEYSDELKNGYSFGDNHWFLSQAYQALAANFATRKMLLDGADGMLWCSLIGGANDASYLKPVIDFYYHPKLAFYSLQDCFKENAVFQDDTDVVWGSGHLIKPVIMSNCDNKIHDVNVILTNLNDQIVFQYDCENVKFNKQYVRLPTKKFPSELGNGFYKYYVIIK